MMRKPLYRENGIERKYICALFGVSIFVCLYIFFTKVTPLYIIDLDDWLYNYYFRRPIPSVRELNPIKILPETWMPITSYLGTYLIYPFTGDLIAAWAMAYAAVLSLMITVYILGAVKVLGKWFEIKNLPLQMIYAVIFLLSHFAVMFQNTGKSHHLFLARDVTCVFNYTIPTLINLIFWMYFFDQDKRWNSLIPEKMGWLLLGLYLTIFSSLFQSIVLMSLFGMQLLFALIIAIRKNIREKKVWINLELIYDYVKVHYPKLLSLIVWFISMAFQLGRRADDISGAMQLDVILTALIKILTEKLNPYVCAAVLVINATAVGLATSPGNQRGDQKFLTQWGKIMGSILLTLVYLMLLTGKLSDAYFLRTEVIINWLTLVLFLTAFSLVYIVKKMPKMLVILPVLLGCLVFVVFSGNTYHAYNEWGLENAVVKAIDDDIIKQVTAVQEEGLTEVRVFLPESLSDKEWPLDVEMTSLRIGESLFRHGIISEKMEITVIPSSEKDVQFGLK